MSSPRTEPLCSARILGPFLRMISGRGEHRDLVPDAFWSARPDSRVPLAQAAAMLAGGAERFRDEHLGLKMGRSMRFGEGGVFDYAIRSAPTVLESMKLAARYCRIHADPFRIRLEAWRSYAVIRLEDSTWNRLGADFGMSAFFKTHVAEEVPARARLECWLPRPAPRHASEYEQTFAGASLKFGAPFYAFAFDRAYQEAPLAASDPTLHHLLRGRIEEQLAALAEWNTVSVRVQRFIREELAQSGRGVTAERAARALQMSVRTMGRRLCDEGSSFGDELDRARRELVLDYMATGGSLKEIAFALGYSHVESFHRAFKRWTDQTPEQYRRLSRRAKPSTRTVQACEGPSR